MTWLYIPDFDERYTFWSTSVQRSFLMPRFNSFSVCHSSVCSLFPLAWFIGHSSAKAMIQTYACGVLNMHQFGLKCQKTQSGVLGAMQHLHNDLSEGSSIISQESENGLIINPADYVYNTHARLAHLLMGCR